MPDQIDDVQPDAELPESEQPEAVQTDATTKRKGIAQMAGGAVIAAAGIPMMILPGPGVAAIVGGVAMVGKGYENFTGKTAPTPDEVYGDDPDYNAGKEAGEQAAERMKVYAAEEFNPTMRVVANEAKEGIKHAASKAAVSAGNAAKTGADLTLKTMSAALGNEEGAFQKLAEEDLKPLGRRMAEGAYNGLIKGVGAAIAGTVTAVDIGSDLVTKGYHALIGKDGK